MKIEDLIKNENVDFTGIELSYFLIGLISAFENRFQAVADSMMKIISWKQFFAIICINLCKSSPSIKELAQIMGNSHQNTKQILLKLEKKGFVKILTDEKDRRIQRVQLTSFCRDFCMENDDKSSEFLSNMFQGISQEALQITIQTIIQMENNIKTINE